MIKNKLNLDEQVFPQIKSIVTNFNKIYQYKNRQANFTIPRSIRKPQDIQLLPITSRKILFGTKYPNRPGKAKKPAIFYSFTVRIDNAGDQIYFPISKNDYAKYIELEKDQFIQSGVNSKDRCSIVAFSQDATIPKSQALMSIGATYIPLDGDEQDIFENIINQQVTVIFTVPQFVFRFMDYVQVHKSETYLRLIVTTGVKIPNKMEIYRKIKQILGAELRETIGSTELGTFAVSCRADPNYFHFLDRHHYIEIINPETHKPDVKGNIVITPLWKRDYPLLRYDTGDYIELVPHKPDMCPCNSHRMFGGIQKRSDNTVRIERFLTSLPELYLQLEALLKNQYRADKIVWRFINPPLLVLLLIEDNHSDELLLFIEKNISNFSLRKINPLIKFAVKASNAKTKVIYCPKNDLIDIVPKYQDIRNIESLRIPNEIQKLLGKYAPYYR
jgi:phenylacetate-coenzyme A ligase PaaK-like adenylate-forming protein